MTDGMQPEGIQELSLSVRSDLASVWRTVEWHLLDSARIAKASHVGMTCNRLLRRCLSDDGLTSEVRDSLTRLSEMLAQFDSSSESEREAILRGVREELLTHVSMGEMGAGRPDLARVGRLVKSRRRDDRRRRDKTSAPSEAQPADANVKSERSEGAVAEKVEKPEDEVLVEAPASTGPSNQDGPEEEPQRKRASQRRRTPRVARVRKLNVGHPEGTGRSLSTMGWGDESLVAQLEARGVVTIMDLLNLAPADHIRATQLMITAETDAEEFEMGQMPMIRGRIRIHCSRLSSGTARRELMLELKGGLPVRCVWSGDKPRGWDLWHAGMEIALVGSPELTDDGWTLFEAEPVGVDGRGSGWLPNYALEGFEDRSVRDLVAQALSSSVGLLRDPMPDRLLDRNRLMPLDQAYRDAHFPANKSGKGRGRLAFGELLMLQAGIAWRGRSRQRIRGKGLELIHKIVGNLEAQHGFLLTDGQEIAFSDIRRGLKSRQPMVRLLQGEVGTDKASIALLAAVLVADSKAQVVYILPDDMAAERRYLFSEGLLRSVGIASMRIEGTPDRGQLDALARGNCEVVFGTKAILAAQPEWKRLGLVIVEERDEYGTVDPAHLAENSPAPDLLVITDTPIPSSLALTIFGEYEVSMVAREHAMRVNVEVREQADRAQAYAIAREQVQMGHQAYVCFPVGEAGDLLSTDDALRFAEALQQDAFPEARIGVYCSEMSGEDRLRVFHDFEQRRIDVLVCTTYVEEAPVVGNATAMVVEHADRHELIRLHRLRGHVGHGQRSGHCLIILSDEPGEEGRAHVDRLMAEDDGFRIAEIDLQDRGASAVLGSRASEIPQFSWTDPVKDLSLMLQAREESFSMVRQDPGMRRSVDFGNAIRQRWGGWLGAGLPEPAESQGSGSGSGSGGGGRRRRRRRRRR